jgi:nitroreductase
MFLSLVQKRRSIRKFLKKPVEEKKINMLIEAALRSPSSMGSRPCELLIVTERGLLARLSIPEKCAAWNSRVC